MPTPAADFWGELPMSAHAALRRDILRRFTREAAMLESTKWCPSCQARVPLADFAKDASRGDGVQWRCSPCIKVARGPVRTP